MKNNNIKTIFVLLFVSLSLSSCINLKAVNDYASAATKGIQKFEDIKYSYNQQCLDKDKFKNIIKMEMKKDDNITNSCEDFKEGDNANLIIYTAINNYFKGLANLSNEDLTKFNFEPLNKSLNEGNFGSINFDKADVDAYTKIVQLLSEPLADIYRGNKIKKYVGEANAPIQILLSKFQFAQENIVIDLKQEKKDLHQNYFNLFDLNNFTFYEKMTIVREYNQKVAEINSNIEQYEIFINSVKATAEGHQKLYDNRNKMTEKEIKNILIVHAGKIKDIITEFNKLKK